PNGSNWTERNRDRRTSVNPWQTVEGADIRYAATLDGTTWRGEASIPWAVIGDTTHGRPVLLRFNFLQHRHDIGESASWAGPVDFGRDDSFTGVLFIKDGQ